LPRWREAFARIGTLNNTGTRLLCVSGHVQRPGTYEFESGKITLGRLLNEICGGRGPAASSRRSSPRFLVEDSPLRRALQGQAARRTMVDWGVEDIPMDFDSLAACGTMAAPVASS